MIPAMSPPYRDMRDKRSELLRRALKRSGGVGPFSFQCHGGQNPVAKMVFRHKAAKAPLVIWKPRGTGK
jgi:hypothetical protein